MPLRLFLPTSQVGAESCLLAQRIVDSGLDLGLAPRSAMKPGWLNAARGGQADDVRYYLSTEGRPRHNFLYIR
jgi:hypothetical protein